ncbi:Fatty acyl-CoA reductase [Aphelenchoides besseyi]|nr:Fatty acyl-CoA reductase [Aphelenchoides besseyi]KAI6201089.1 Fatty acyl-CoA reductase [Aphelenchoides besseyi]
MDAGLCVADTFANRSVFVTGASGFLGKVLIEKLLFSNPHINQIYVLIRPLKGHGPRDRLNKILQSPIFQRIREKDDELLKKLVPISGDLMEEGLGLSPADEKLLCETVSIVFHCAATVKFDEVLRVSVQMNVIGTQRLVALCHKMSKLTSLVHASTAYANCNLSDTEERIYDPPVDPEKLIEATKWMSDEMLEAITPMLLKQRPNTYTFAKAVAESQLQEDARGLPTIIVRPSIIGAMWKEPLPGWTDNVNGPTGIFAGCGKGLLTNMCGSSTSNADIIPVDIVSNTLIVAAAYRANLKSSDEMPVIHCCSGTLNPLKWERIVNYIQRFYLKYPLDQCYRVPSTHFHSSRLLFLLNFYAKHYIPAHVLDALCVLTGRKPTFVKIYGKVWRMIETLHYFTTRGWQFKTEKLLSLWECLSEEDKQIYNFDIRQVNWDRYLFDYLMGIKIYLLQEKLEDLPKARSNLSWLKQLSIASIAIVWTIITRIFARNTTGKQKWTIWISGVLLTYAFQNVDVRPFVYLKSLEEYKKTLQLSA